MWGRRAAEKIQSLEETKITRTILFYGNGTLENAAALERKGSPGEPPLWGKVSAAPQAKHEAFAGIFMEAVNPFARSFQLYGVALLWASECILPEWHVLSELNVRLCRRLDGLNISQNFSLKAPLRSLVL